MNEKDRNRITRLNKFICEIPFSKSGAATQTGYGSIMFEQDMRAVRPYIFRVMEGIVLEGRKGLDLWWDYFDPDILLDYLEAWANARSSAGWVGASEYSFEREWKPALERYREQTGKG